MAINSSRSDSMIVGKQQVYCEITLSYCHGELWQAGYQYFIRQTPCPLLGLIMTSIR